MPAPLPGQIGPSNRETASFNGVPDSFDKGPDSFDAVVDSLNGEPASSNRAGVSFDEDGDGLDASAVRFGDCRGGRGGAGDFLGRRGVARRQGAAAVGAARGASGRCEVFLNVLIGQT